MNPLKLIIQSLLHFRKRNILLALGFAISTAVLTGALIVGDSVKYSLNKIVEQRLGNISMVLQTGDRYFTNNLSNTLRSVLDKSVSALLTADGVAIAEGGLLRMNDVHIIGVDSSFDDMADLVNYYSGLADDSVIVSSNLAQRLNLSEGDEFLLRMTRASLVPLNAPFVSDADNIISMRVTIAAIAGEKELGTFNILNSQTAPFNVFISEEKLRSVMDLGPHSNLMLFSDNAFSSNEIENLINENWTPEDAGLSIRYDQNAKYFEFKSDRVFLDDALSDAFSKSSKNGIPVLTYFINSISTKDALTPYSFISTLPDDQMLHGEIIVNQWLADDLNAGVGDSVSITYYTVGPLRELRVDTAGFTISRIVPISGSFADKHLMPDIPGMSDAGSCRDWEAGVPVELGTIRDKDENYWTRYKGTPKAFISLSMAEELWKNRFGTYTAYRIYGDQAEREELEQQIMLNLDPASLGFDIQPIRHQASFAAANGVDFSELFGGLSFFLLAGAIILSVLLFRLNLEERQEQVRTLAAMGIPFRKIRNIMLNETLIVARLGGLAGMGLAIVYNRFIFHALNSVWVDIIRTDMLSVNIRIFTLLIGYIISIAIAWAVAFFVLNRFLKKAVSRHIKKTELKNTMNFKSIVRFLAYLTVVIALLLLTLQLWRNETTNPTVFFAAGGLLLVSGISFSYLLLLKFRSNLASTLQLRAISMKNAVSNLPRSMSIIILLAIGTFIVISTGSNKKDLFAKAAEKSSGTGGFLFYAESTIPFLKNLNSEDVRYDYGLSKDYSIIQMRVAEGDDASCLNLNRITNPRILGVDPARLSNRFSFVSELPELNESDPWSSLSGGSGSGLIPAIADETVIKWGLGLKVGDTLYYKDALGSELKLLLMGGLAPSIFQGSVLISEENFLKHFPGSSGTEAFLVDGAIADTSRINEELSLGMRDHGWSMDYAAKRLAEFNSVTNTYLSIFLILGALGLLLGTIGLSIILFRSIIERREELALLRAVGFPMSTLKLMLIREYFILLFAGTMIGAISSVIATLPSFLSRNVEVSLPLIGLIVVLLLVNGIIWISWMTNMALKNKSLSVSLRNE